MTEQLFGHKKCEGLIEFDSFGNWRCKLCGKVSKGTKEIIIISQSNENKNKEDKNGKKTN
ncbi:hypothetical protein [Lutibacter sp.]|uniref:hypothetical protein n=1 Tax=Lutibacter sp. TaxID=1925666 RepID=UPI00349FDA43